jgi:hypothetical protein
MCYQPPSCHPLETRGHPTRLTLSCLTLAGQGIQQSTSNLVKGMLCSSTRRGVLLSLAALMFALTVLAANITNLIVTLPWVANCPSYLALALTLSVGTLTLLGSSVNWARQLYTWEVNGMYESVSVSPEDYLLTSSANDDTLLLSDGTDVCDTTGRGGLCACLPHSEKRYFTVKFTSYETQSVLLKNTHFTNI